MRWTSRASTSTPTRAPAWFPPRSSGCPWNRRGEIVRPPGGRARALHGGGRGPAPVRGIRVRQDRLEPPRHARSRAVEPAALLPAEHGGDPEPLLAHGGHAAD